jgi:glycosidase
MKHQIIQRYAIIVLSIFLVIFPSCMKKKPSEQPQPEKPGMTEVVNVDWIKNASIYEVNLRQYTPEGTINAFAEHLPRLKELGIDILWLMPVNPIGVKNRKGELGSYYSVKDYQDVNPEFGTIDDFKALVNKVHELGMYLVIDWVPNHSSWDNPLIEEHPEWYEKDENGEMFSPFDWTDVVQFDYDQQGLRDYMVKTLQWWITETDLDGFRFDVAHQVPVDFWEDLRPLLMEVKPVFLLAEADQPFLHKKAFDATYGWPFHHLMNEIASEKKTANAISYHFGKVDSLYPGGSIIMQFTSNHDENSWNGTVRERLGEGVETFAVLSFTVPGMPLIYNGQEAGLDKRLEFFIKDEIEWKDDKLFDFYQALISLKKRNQALWNGIQGGTLTRVTSSDNKSVYAFLREKGEDKVFVILNLTDKPVDVTLKGIKYTGEYTDVFDNESVTFEENTNLSLEPWEYHVYEK